MAERAFTHRENFGFGLEPDSEVLTGGTAQLPPYFLGAASDEGVKLRRIGSLGGQGERNEGIHGMAGHSGRGAIS